MYELINESNERFPLRNLADYAFIPSVGGKGFKNNSSYVKVGNTYLQDHTEVSQGTLSGTLIFSSHENYREFVDYIESATSLRFISKPADIEYFRDIDVGDLSDYVEKGGIIEAEVSFICKSLYYTSADKRFEVVPVDGQSQYPLVFPFVFNDNASTDIYIDNVGHTEAEMVAEIYGFIENPVISLYQNNELIYRVTFAITLQAGEKLVYAARDGNPYIVKIDINSVETNAISVLNIENDNFFKIPKGSSKIVIDSDSGIFTKIVLQIISMYKGI